MKATTGLSIADITPEFCRSLKVPYWMAARVALEYRRKNWGKRYFYTGLYEVLEAMSLSRYRNV